VNAPYTKFYGSCCSLAFLFIAAYGAQDSVSSEDPRIRHNGRMKKKGSVASPVKFCKPLSLEGLSFTFRSPVLPSTGFTLLAAELSGHCRSDSCKILIHWGDTERPMKLVNGILVSRFSGHQNFETVPLHA